MLHLSIAVIIYETLGLASLKFQFVYTFWGIFFLDLANYFEHYGLVRKKDKNGIYESISRYHSWNHISTALYFRLQRHSDHHTASFRPYQILRRWDDVPWCPFQTTSCLWTTIIPPLWFYCMNPRVDALNNFLNGKTKSGPGEASFTNLRSQLTEHDKWIKKVVWVYVSCLTVIFAYFCFVYEGLSVYHEPKLIV